ncbi:MAG: hypothetical protein ACYC6Y_28405, partial [Thermoguttaceae bacterium]
MAADPDSIDRPADTPRREVPRRDTLTIGRFLLLTAGVAVGLGVFVSADAKGSTVPGELNLDKFIVYYNALLIGLALPAPLFILGQRLRRGPDVGPGGLYAVTVGLGSLLMLPPILVDHLQSEDGIPFVCLHYMLPLVSFWYLAAALIGGSLRRTLFARTTAWTERYGFFLALLWTPIGLW